jgi:hypothetical protein
MEMMQNIRKPKKLYRRIFLINILSFLDINKAIGIEIKEKPMRGKFAKEREENKIERNESFLFFSRINLYVKNNEVINNKIESGQTLVV